MGYSSERKGFNRDLRRNSSLSSMRDWSIRDSKFPVYCQELDDTEPSSCPFWCAEPWGFWRQELPVCSVSASRKSLTPLSSDWTQKELLALQNPHQSRVGSVLACGFVCLAPRGITRTYYEKCLTVCCRNMWDSSVLIDNLNELGEGAWIPNALSYGCH